jgi:hypothetical protein
MGWLQRLESARLNLIKMQSIYERMPGKSAFQLKSQR